MNEWKFNINDLDQEALEAKAIEEADGVWCDGKGSQVKGRSYEQLLADCKRGSAAERYVREKQGFTNDPRPFKDVFDPSNVSVEVKVTTSDWVAEKYTIPKCNADRRMAWRKFSDIVYLFINPKDTEEYYLHKILTWDGYKFL